MQNELPFRIFESMQWNRLHIFRSFSCSFLNCISIFESSRNNGKKKYWFKLDFDNFDVEHLNYKFWGHEWYLTVKYNGNNFMLLVMIIKMIPTSLAMGTMYYVSIAFIQFTICMWFLHIFVFISILHIYIYDMPR